MYLEEIALFMTVIISQKLITNKILE